MKRNAINKITYLLNSTLFLIVGLTLIIFKSKYLNFFHMLSSILLIILGSLTFIINIMKLRKPKDIFISLSTLNFGIYFLYDRERFLSLFPILFGIYMLINGIGKFMTYIIFKNRENTSYYNSLLGSLIDFIFSYIMITSPSKNVERLTIILGLYLLLFSITYFNDFLKELFPDKNSSKRRIRVTLPIILGSFIPYGVLLSLNKIINKWKTPVKITNKNTSGKVDIEVLIHIRETDTVGRFGHADIVYKGKVYSYGCYDEDSKRLLKSMGDGTLYEIKGKEKYIKFCNEFSNKTIFSFGITLTEEDRKKVEEKLNIIKKNSYSWDPSKTSKNNYALELKDRTDAKFYKFKEGSYKTYFIMFTNCAKLVDDVIGVTGSDILKINGVITPGTYYNYLEKELKRKNSKVISKKIYSSKKIHE